MSQQMAEVFFLTTYMGLLSIVAVLTIQLMRRPTPTSVVIYIGDSNVPVNVDDGSSSAAADPEDTDDTVVEENNVDDDDDVPDLEEVAKDD